MFDIGILDKAKSIFSGDASTGERVGNALEVAGTASEFAGAQQARMQGQHPSQNPNAGNAWQAKEGIKNSQSGQSIKKIASAVAAFYTGGLSALATNVGTAAIAKNNPQAAGLASIASKVWGG